MRARAACCCPQWRSGRQVDGSDTKVAYGSGLGMHITRQILDRHGGSIRYVSAPGVGTTFTISLPLVA